MIQSSTGKNTGNLKWDKDKGEDIIPVIVSSTCVTSCSPERGIEQAGKTDVSLGVDQEAMALRIYENELARTHLRELAL